MADKKDLSKKSKRQKSQFSANRPPSQRPYTATPGKPGTMAEAIKAVEAREFDETKVTRISDLPGFASYPLGAPSIVEQARALNNDPQLIFEYVYDNIDWQTGWGPNKGALGALMDQTANAWDQSALLVALLTQAGYSAEFVLGQIQLTTTQFDAWFGTTTNTYDSTASCYNYAQAYC